MSEGTAAIKNVLDRTALFSDGDASVMDVACRAARGGFCDEEAVEAAQVIVPRRGTFAWRANGTDTVVDAATAVVVSAGTRYQVAHPRDCGDDCTTITIGRDAPAAFVTIDASFRNELNAIRRACDGLEAHERAVMLFERVRSSRRIGSIQHSKREPLEHARTLVARNFDRPLSLARIAHEVYISPYHLARQFRAYTGVSIHQYRMAVRLHEAFSRVTESDTELGQIGIDVGFSSASHFSAIFASRFGMTPTEARFKR
jgi:AraC-like DNA-binding protein